MYVSVDGVGLGAARRAGGPLYVLLWEPSLYLTGPHTISVKVEVIFRFLFRYYSQSWTFSCLFFIAVHRRCIVLIISQVP